KIECLGPPSRNTGNLPGVRHLYNRRLLESDRQVDISSYQKLNRTTLRRTVDPECSLFQLSPPSNGGRARAGIDHCSSPGICSHSRRSLERKTLKRGVARRGARCTSVSK